MHGGSLLPRGGDDALIEGTLAVREGCILLGLPGDPAAYPVVWPSGTSISNEDPLTLDLPGGDELGIGEVVSGGGGVHHVTSARVEVDIPARCLPGSEEVIVYNPDDDLSVR